MILIPLNPLAGVETKQFFVDLHVFLVLLGFLSFAYSSFCLVFLASQKTKKHEQPENQETQNQGKHKSKIRVKTNVK